MVCIAGWLKFILIRILVYLCTNLSPSEVLSPRSNEPTSTTQQPNDAATAPAPQAVSPPKPGVRRPRRMYRRTLGPESTEEQLP